MVRRGCAGRPLIPRSASLQFWPCAEYEEFVERWHARASRLISRALGTINYAYPAGV